MQTPSTPAPYLQCELPDVQGQSVTVQIDPAQAQHLLRQFSQAFNWHIHWQPKPSAQTHPSEKIEDFARHLLSVCSAVPPAGRFGEQQVFINHAWRVWQNAGGQLALSAFKIQLLQAQQVGLLHLSCSALIQTLNAMDLAQSETTSEQNVVYHFIDIS